MRSNNSIALASPAAAMRPMVKAAFPAVSGFSQTAKSQSLEAEFSMIVLASNLPGMLMQTRRQVASLPRKPPGFVPKCGARR